MNRSAPAPALPPLFAMEIFSGLSRGAFLVAIGWNTLVITNEVSRVGQVFIVSMLTVLLLGPFMGTVVDRQDRRNLVILAHGGLAAVLMGLGLFWVGNATPGLGWLFLAVAAASGLRAIHNMAHDGLIQRAVDASRLVQTVARFRTVHLASTALGTMATGYVINRYGPAAGFYSSAAASLMLIVPMVFVPRQRPGAPPSARPGFWTDLQAGLALFHGSQTLRRLALLAAVSLPIGQLSNAILSSLIRDDLLLGSDAFGIVDAAWPIGGMLGALVLSLGIRKLSALGAEYLFALLAGLMTIGLSFGEVVPLLFILHGGMGLAVWLCRIVIDSRVLQLCTADTVGRTKAGLEMMFCLSALVMCLSPSLISLPETASYFLFWGCLMVGISGFFWWRAR